MNYIDGLSKATIQRGLMSDTGWFYAKMLRKKDERIKELTAALEKAVEALNETDSLAMGQYPIAKDFLESKEYSNVAHLLFKDRTLH